MLSNTIHPRGTLLQGRYRIIDIVGTGGYGVVYRAEDIEEDDVVVAVKSINLAGLSTQEVIEATEAFNREVTLLSKLRHASLPVIHDHFTDPEHWYMVMDFIEGETLEDYIAHSDPDVPQNGTRCLPLLEVLNIGMQLCTALGYLHMQEPAIIFRDLKPANIMRMADGHLYLIDFGIARRFTQGQAKDTIPLGSPGYAAPEQYGKTQTTPRSDIYSLGAVLHQLITGDDPSESPFQFAHLLTEDNPVLEALDELLLQMVERDERNRPGSITIVKRRLQQIQAQMSSAQVVQMPVKTRKIQVSRRVFVGALAAGVVTVAVARTMPNLVSQISGTFHIGDSSIGDSSALYTYRSHQGTVTSVAWSPNGDMIASGDTNGNVYVWKPWGETILSWPGAPTSQNVLQSAVGILALSWSSDGQQLAIADGNGNVNIWDFRKKAIVFTYASNMVLNSMAWSPNGAYIAVGSSAFDVRIWKADTISSVADLKGSSNNVLAISWSPGSRYLATGCAFGTLILWDVVKGTAVYTYTDFEGGMEPVNVVAWSPDDTFLVANRERQNGSGYDLSVLPAMTVTASDPVFYSGHSGPVTAAQWSPDSSLIASASMDTTVQVWNSARGQTQKTYTGHGSPVHAVSWSPKGQLIASGGEDATVQLWKP